MGSEQQTKAVISSFSTFSEEYFDIFLHGKPSWRGRNLQECRKAFNDLLLWKTSIEKVALSTLPDAVLRSIVDAAENFQLILESTRSVLENAPNPPSLGSGQLDQVLIDANKAVFDAVTQVGTACQGAVLLLDYAEAYESKNQIFQLKEKAESDAREIDKILDRIRDLAAAKSIKQFERHFNEYAAELTGEASAWLVATVVLGVLTAFSVIALFVWQVTVFQSAFDTNGLVLYVLSKVVLLGLMIGATVWTGRNFKAAKHQLALTKHRAISLATFEVFPMSTSDPDVRSAILLETAKTVFGQAPSGYLEKESAQLDPTAIGSEAIKALVSKKAAH